MKISICIPQYNRIQYLVASLEIIKKQTYHDIEIVISDDCSTDNTEEIIFALIKDYKYPIVYNRNDQNMGYDYNYRKCISLASGKYAIVIGNDDSIFGENSIHKIVEFIKYNNYPDIGFCNLIEASSGNTPINRAIHTKCLGSGTDIALKYYSCFSFVGGLIYKKDTFERYNTSKHDGSIYAQMYLGVYMICMGAVLFSFKEPFVLKDLVLINEHRNSYKDKIARKWSEFKIVDSGLPSVIHVLLSAILDAKQYSAKRAYSIFSRIYRITYPHWILDFKQNKALPEAFGLIIGMNPLLNKDFFKLIFIHRLRIFGSYFIVSIFSLVFPVFIYSSLKQKIYTLLKK